MFTSHMKLQILRHMRRARRVIEVALKADPANPGLKQALDEALDSHERVVMMQTEG
jgi:hypothetical protein